MSKEDCGFIYIMTNPAMKGLIKIGYATDAEKRRKELSHASGVPADFELYAAYSVPVKLADKKVHNVIITLNPELKFNPKKEFFTMNPEDAYKILEAIASIHGREDKLFRYIDGKPVLISTPEEESDEDIPSKTTFDFDSETLKVGGKKTRNHIIDILRKSGVYSESDYFTFSSINKDGSKRYWANPNIKCKEMDWCLVLRNTDSNELYIFKIPAHSLPDDYPTREHQGNTELRVAILKKDDTFVCSDSKVDYSKWLLKSIKY